MNDPGADTGSDPTAIAASLQAGEAPNTLSIRWDFSGPADHFVVEGNPDGASGYAGIDINGDGRVDADDRIPPETDSIRIPLALHLTDFDNALYRVTARDRAGTELASSRGLGLFGMPTDDLIGHLAADTEADNDFRSAVALSADGRTLALGAQSDRLEFGPGAVYVFARADGGWSRQAYIPAPDTAGSDDFGFTVALSDNGDTLAIGARADSSGATGVDGDRSTGRAGGLSGAVYIFRRAGGTWSRQSYIKASNTDEADFFGFSVALAGDGDTLAVGAPGEDGASTGVGGDDSDNSAGAYGAIAGGAGAVYVFSRGGGGGWSQQAYIKASNTEMADGFGWNVALSGAGDTLAVGAPGESSAATGIDGDQSSNGAGGAGAVYVFGRSDNRWAQQVYVKASNTASGDRFGHALALSGSGTTLAVGAPREDSSVRGVGGNQSDDRANDSGAVYLFTRTTRGWSQQAYIKASNTDRSDRFGHAVALSGSGHMLAVGANAESSAATGVGGNQSLNNASAAGAAYVFTHSGRTWSQQAYVKAPNTASGDHFGNAVDLSDSGNRLAVAGHHPESASGGFGGTSVDIAYLY